MKPLRLPAVFLCVLPALASGEVRFNRDVRPILSKN